jgi:hypothetical protein
MSALDRELEQGGQTNEARVRRALRSRAAWRTEEPWLERARALGVEPDDDVGQALFLTTSGGRGGLWRLEPARSDRKHCVDLGAEAKRTAERCRIVVARDVTAFLHPERLAHPKPWMARRLAGGGSEIVVDGPSLGLAVALAQVSLLTELLVLPSVVAAAQVEEDGSLAPVDELGVKLRTLAEWAPGIDTLLVATAQAEEADRICQRLKLEVSVQSLGSVADALPHAFAQEPLQALESKLEGDAALAAEVAHRLFVLALDNRSQLQTWGGLASFADRVAALLEDEGPRLEAQIAASIAHRHDGPAGPLPPIPRDWLDRHPRPRRLRLVAQVVQSANDAGGTGWGDARTLAESELAPSRYQVEVDLRLLGALGRAHAAEHEWDAAETRLNAALEGWRANDVVAECSFALSELLRIRGIRGDATGVDELVRLAEELEGDPRMPRVSWGYVEHSIFRALIQLGRADEAIRRMPAAPTWGEAPAHVVASHLRWRARAVFDGEPIRRSLQEGAAGRGDGIAFAVHLAAIDGGLEAEDAASVEAAIARLRETETTEVERIDRLRGPMPLAEALAHYWRY